MDTNNLSSTKAKSKFGKSFFNLRYFHIVSLLAIICICFLGFMPPASKTNAANASVKKLYMDPEDMVQDGYYYFADHGSGMSVAQFDRMEGDNIYTKNSIKPLQLSFSGPGLWGTIEDAGNIALATPAQVISLLLSILAGHYVPFP